MNSRCVCISSNLFVFLQLFPDWDEGDCYEDKEKDYGNAHIFPGVLADILRFFKCRGCPLNVINRAGDLQEIAENFIIVQ